MTIWGIDIGGTKSAVCRLAADGTVEELARFATVGPAETLGRIGDIIAASGAGGEPAFGIACGGPLDARAGLILSPPNLPGWDRIAVCDAIVGRFGGRAFLMNDANAGALAEWKFGAGRGCRSMVFLTAGTGMGGGLVLDGRLYEGACGNAGEVGHLRLAPDGPEGYGKRGSFEGFCSGSGIAKIARVRGIADERSSAKELADAARSGDPTAAAVWREVGTRLGEALALLVDVLNPERIVLGSVYVRCRDLLEPAMLETLHREALPESVRACTVLPATLGEAIGNYAAVAIARYHLDQEGHR
jgi:glucokinase